MHWRDHLSGDSQLPHCDTRRSWSTNLSRFPPGDKDADRLREWMVNMRRMDWRPVPSSRLCSAHFEEHAFPTDSKGKRCLKKTAIPTLFPDHQVGSSLKGVKRRILKLLSRVRPHH
ncbi:THAP domain-containing protein 5-like isoform X1 [Notolabrus celidotus]|uniref:THAP domain-containing protein 5-like isoform X1 n=1 Tax=Notolabrus celidotus TaxID=1203425 RepID=UPI00148F675B|nr:THAP domain-containing protein 5-like isoform X1 [Notolabrus celidotus]